MQTFRCPGAGGGGKDTSSSGVRLIHRASGAVGEGRETRSVTQNRKAAFRRLTETSTFKNWHRIECARRMGVKQPETPEQILARVDRMDCVTAPSSLRTLRQAWRCQLPERSNPLRQHHNGPIAILEPSPSSKQNRGLKQSTPASTAEVRVIMRDGEVLQPKRFQQTLQPHSSPIPRSESNLTERYRRLAGVPAKTNPGAIERNRHGRDLDNR